MRWLPTNVSTYGGEIDFIYLVILWITGIVFLLVIGTLVWFSFRYRHTEGRKAHHIHANWKVEVVWTVIPFLIVLGLGAMSFGLWSRVKNPDRFPEPGLTIAVHASQFEWNVTYPGPDGQLGNGDGFRTLNRIHVPVGQPILVHLTAEDVIHSFFLPNFRVKQDAVPGLPQQVWFEATETGEFELACAELCGTGHTRMRGRLVVQSVEEFEAWQREERQNAN
jgi:cytochrome c oxidase subunit II